MSDERFQDVVDRLQQRNAETARRFFTVDDEAIMGANDPRNEITYKRPAASEPGLRVPGLPEGLELLRIQVEEAPRVDGEYVLVERGIINAEFVGRGMFIVRPLSGYTVRYDIYNNVSKVVREYETPNARRFSVECRTASDSETVSNALRDLQRLGLVVSEETE